MNLMYLTYPNHRFAEQYTVPCWLFYHVDLRHWKHFQRASYHILLVRVKIKKKINFGGFLLTNSHCFHSKLKFKNHKLIHQKLKNHFVLKLCWAWKWQGQFDEAHISEDSSGEFDFAHLVWDLRICITN